MKPTSRELTRRARRIRAIISDVDGVLTDGTVLYGTDGGEYKRFHTHDGLAAGLARSAGLKLFMISGRVSSTVERRGRELGFDRIWQGIDDKAPLFAIIKKEGALADEECCCIGDDLLDLPLITRAGLGVTVPSACDELKSAAALVTRRRGGRGAFREVVEFILKAQGKWNEILSNYQ